MNPTTPATRPDHHEGRPSMGKNRRLLSLVAVAGAALALAVGGIQPASADPDNGNPGTPPAYGSMSGEGSFDSGGSSGGDGGGGS